MIGFYKHVIKLLEGAGFYFFRTGKGSHEIWSNGDLRITGPVNCKSRHTANAVLKQAGLDTKI